MPHNTDKEFRLLLNEGTEDEATCTFGEYIKENEEADRDVLNEMLQIGHLAVNETIQVGADFIRRTN